MSSRISIDVEDTRDGTTPSHRILVAIMRRAIWDFALYKDEDPSQYKPELWKTEKKRKQVEKERKDCEKRLEIATDAAGWLFWDGEEETDENGLYTFRYICEVLDLDPAAVRARALSLTREAIQTLNNHIKEE